MNKGIEPISKKISVLMVTGVYFPEINGAVLQCMKIISLLRDNLQFIVLSATKNKNLLKNRSVEGIDVYRSSVSNNRFFYFSQLFGIIFFFIRNKEKFDIVHLHGFSSKSAFIIALSKIFRKKIIIKLTSFGHDDPESVKRKRKLALVIGATGGIGHATCIDLAKDGFDIAVHCHKNYKRAKKIYKEIKKLKRKTVIVQFDTKQEKSVEKNIKFLIKKFKSLDWSDIQKQIDVSIKGLFNVLSCALPTMRKNKFGNIICFSSQYVESPKPELLHYTIAKSALCGFIKSFAMENAHFGIRANIISPGMTDTDLIMDVPEKVKLVTAAQTPLRRLANPHDISGVVSFLASNKSSFLTGETIRVNGGQIML